MLPCFCAAPGEVVSETQNGVENKISEGAKRKFRDPLAGKLLEGEATSYFFNLFYHQRIGHERITLWCLVTMYSGEENLGMTMSGGQNVPFAPGVLGALKCYPEN